MSSFFALHPRSCWRLDRQEMLSLAAMQLSLVLYIWHSYFRNGSPFSLMYGATCSRSHKGHRPRARSNSTVGSSEWTRRLPPSPLPLV